MNKIMNPNDTKKYERCTCQPSVANISKSDWLIFGDAHAIIGTEKTKGEIMYEAVSLLFVFCFVGRALCRFDLCRGHVIGQNVLFISYGSYGYVV